MSNVTDPNTTTLRQGASREVHLVEPSGFGGVFQHACELGERLHRRGRRVVLHTGHEHEVVRLDGVVVCPCSWWPRRDEGSGRVAAAARRSALVASFVLRTLPHLHRTVPRSGVVHVQGTAAASALTLLMLCVARARRRRVVYSPHNTFSRRGAVDARLYRMACRVPHALVVYSESDVEVLGAQGMSAHLSPLVQLVPRPAPDEVQRWRQEWGARPGDSVVLLAGAIRRTKRLDLLIESARSWPPGQRLAVVGEDRGDWRRCAAIAAERGVEIAAHIGYVGLDSFVAAIAASDVVVVPADRASQSGVLAVARGLGVPTVAADVGGLSELASRTFTRGDPAALTRAIDAQLAAARDPLLHTGPADDDLAVHTHLRAYERLT